MPSASPRPPLILVVDDDEYVHRLVEATVRRLRVETLSARSAAEALASAQLRPPDLVLLDLALPDVDGTMLLAILKELPTTRDVPVVVVSGLVGHPATRSEHVAGFVAKPFRPTALIQVIEAVLGGAVDERRPDLRPLPA